MNDENPEHISEDDDMAPEYDFSGGVRGKHALALQGGYKVIVHKADGTSEDRDFAIPEGTVVLAPDVREYFPDSDAVNRALRGLIELIPHR